MRVHNISVVGRKKLKVYLSSSNTLIFLYSTRNRSLVRNKKTKQIKANTMKQDILLYIPSITNTIENDLSNLKIEFIAVTSKIIRDLMVIK